MRVAASILVLLVAGTSVGCEDGPVARGGPGLLSGRGGGAGVGRGGTAGGVGGGHEGGSAGSIASSGVAGESGGTDESGVAGSVGPAGNIGAAGSPATASGTAGATGAPDGVGGGPASPVRAGCDPAWVTYDFTGTVTDSVRWPNSTRFPVDVGEPVVGYYCFDPATAKAFEDPGSTLYDFDFGTNATWGLPPPLFVYALSVRDITLTIAPDFQTSWVTVTDGDAGDRYFVHPRDLLLNGKRVNTALADLTATASDGAALTSNDLIAPLDLARFDERTIDILVADENVQATASWDTLTRVR